MPHRRYDASIEVHFTDAADFLAHYASTISKGSLFVPSGELQALGSVLQISMHLPITHAIADLSGIVAAEVNAGEQRGMLVHLMPLSDNAENLIDACVRQIEGKSRGRVMVVHEDKDYRASVRDLLESNGYGTITVASPLRALEVLRPGGVDLVLVSLTHEEMDGLRFAEKAATLALPLSVGLLLVGSSSKLPAEERKRAKRFGVIGIMKQSAKPETIVRAVDGSFARQARKPISHEAGATHDPKEVTGREPAPEPLTSETSATKPVNRKPRQATVTHATTSPFDEGQNTVPAPAVARPREEVLLRSDVPPPDYPDIVTERHEFADMLDRHLQKLGVRTRRTADGRGVEGQLDLSRIKLVTPFGNGKSIPSISVVGVGRDKVKCIGPAPMDELAPIDIIPLETQEDLEKKIMGAFNRRLKAVYRVKGWLSTFDIPTHLDPERFCCFGRSEIGGHKIVFSAHSQDDALLEEINGRTLNGIMPAQDRRFSLDGIRSRSDLDLRIDPLIAAAQQALLTSSRDIGQ